MVSEKIVAKEAMRCRIHVKNPFEYKLTGCVLTIEGQAMGEQIEKVKDLAPNEEAKLNITLNPKKAGPKKTLLIDFDSKEIKDIKGFYEVTVEAAKDA